MKFSGQPMDVEWLLPILKPTGRYVSSYVPGTYARFVRVLNPAHDAPDKAVRWAQLAGQAGLEVDASTQWIDIERRLSPQTRTTIRAPEMGSLDNDVAAGLRTILDKHTEAGISLTFAFWEGYADVPQDNTEKIDLSEGRSYSLASGSLDDIVDGVTSGPFQRRAMRFWPDDHKWCVGNDIYARSVFIGGTTELIDDLMDSLVLEAYEAHPDTHVYDESLELRVLPPQYT